MYDSWEMHSEFEPRAWDENSTIRLFMQNSYMMEQSHMQYLPRKYENGPQEKD